MTPWGYTITVDLVSESDDETIYVCHQQMRAVIYPHPKEKH